MKTKLTLNIDDKIVARAKKAGAKRKESLSAVVEEYLDRYSKKDSPQKKENSPSLLERIRKYTKHIEFPQDYDYKKVWHQHLDEKYGQ